AARRHARGDLPPPSGGHRRGRRAPLDRDPQRPAPHADRIFQVPGDPRPRGSAQARREDGARREGHAAAGRRDQMSARSIAFAVWFYLWMLIYGVLGMFTFLIGPRA